MIYKKDSLQGMRQAGWNQEPVAAANGTPVYAMSTIRNFCTWYDAANAPVNFLGGFEGYDERGDYKTAQLDGLYIDDRGYGWMSGPDGKIVPEAVMKDGKAYQVVRSPSTLMNAMSGQESGYLEVLSESDRTQRGYMARGDAVRALEDSAFLQSTKRGKTKTAEFSFVDKGDYAVFGFDGDVHGELIRTVTPAADAGKDGKTYESPVAGYGVTKDYSCDELARRAAGIENGTIAYLNFRKGDSMFCPISGGPVQSISRDALMTGICVEDDMMPGTIMESVSVPCLLPYGNDADQPAMTLAASMVRMQSTSGRETILLSGKGERVQLRDSAVDYGFTAAVPETDPVHIDPTNALSPDMDLERVSAAIKSWGAEADPGKCVRELGSVHSRAEEINPWFYGRALGGDGRAFVGEGPTRDAADYASMDSGLASYGAGALPEPKITWIDAAKAMERELPAPAPAEPATAPAPDHGTPVSGFERLLGMLEKQDGADSGKEAETKGGQLSVEGIV